MVVVDIDTVYILLDRLLVLATTVPRTVLKLRSPIALSIFCITLPRFGSLTCNLSLSHINSTLHLLGHYSLDFSQFIF